MAQALKMPTGTKAVVVQFLGPWELTKYVLEYGAVQFAKTRLGQSLDEVGNILVSHMQHGIRKSGSFNTNEQGWPTSPGVGKVRINPYFPITPFTVSTRRSQRRRKRRSEVALNTLARTLTPLMDMGTLHRSIRYKRTSKQRGAVGVFRMFKRRGHKRAHNLALYHEFGAVLRDMKTKARVHIMPARPFIRPALVAARVDIISELHKAGNDIGMTIKKMLT